MSVTKIHFDGNNFDTLIGFYDEVESVLTTNLGWNTGKNLDAFNDLLRGGFGIHEYGQPLEIQWINAQKSKEDLGWEETINHLNKKLRACLPSNHESVKIELQDAIEHRGKTLFELIIDIISEHKHVKLTFV